jgi:hypothetical protein
MIEGEFCISILTFFLFCWWEINAGPFFMGSITVAHVTISKRIKPRGPQSCPEFTLILCCLVNWTIAAFHQKRKEKKKTIAASRAVNSGPLDLTHLQPISLNIIIIIVIFLHEVETIDDT